MAGHDVSCKDVGLVMANSADVSSTSSSSTSSSRSGRASRSISWKRKSSMDKSLAISGWTDDAMMESVDAGCE
uniref:Uncharacterized protein n=1 Tax=Hyaloperonospora arabidopsidis (strain Emoy2) TaxID=559515 RepID=M4BMZ2_HYAAE